MGRIAAKCFITDKINVLAKRTRLGIEMAPCSYCTEAFRCVLFVHLIGYNRVASVQSEPGQQNLLIQPPLGRKRGLRQVDVTFLLFKIFRDGVDHWLSVWQLRRPLLSIPKNEPRGRSGARLSTTRRSIQPKNKPLGNVCA